MAPHMHADQSGAATPDPGAVDALITQARRLRRGVDAVIRDAVPDREDPQLRWRRALCELAVHQLDDLGAHLGQLRDGLADDVRSAPAPVGPGDAGCGHPPGADASGTAAYERGAAAPSRGRAGSAEWNLLTDEVQWSEELYRIFGRSRQDGPLTLDELPSWLFTEDQQILTSMVTGCLVDGRPLDGEFRVVRADGSVRTLHMVGEPTFDAGGATASLWAVVQDVSDLRQTELALHESRDSAHRRRQVARTEHRPVVELQEAVLPPWRGALRFLESGGPASVDLAAHYLPSATSDLIGGDWYDALELPGGAMLLTVGDLSGHGAAATSDMAMLLGALRGMAVAGMEPGPLMGALSRLLDTAQPTLGSALCCRFEPDGNTLAWAQAGHSAPLLFRGGKGRVLDPPEGLLLGASAGARYGQATESLVPGDLLVLHTGGLAPRRTSSATADAADGVRRLLALAPFLAQARSARECVRLMVEEFSTPQREDDACVLVARIGPDRSYGVVRG